MISQFPPGRSSRSAKSGRSVLERASAPILTSTRPSFCPSAKLARSCREMSGSIVFVRMLSTLRAPLSTSVQRSATSSTTAGS